MVLRQPTASCRQQQCTTSKTSPSQRSTTMKVIYCDSKTTVENKLNARSSSNDQESCDQNLISSRGRSGRPVIWRTLPLLLVGLLLATPTTNKPVWGHLQQQPSSTNSTPSSTFAHIQGPDRLAGPASGATSAGHAHTLASPHLQPSYVYGPPSVAPATQQTAANRNATRALPPASQPIFNFTHIAYDELTNSIYVGGTNWLFQLSGANLRPEHALKVGPASMRGGHTTLRDCSTSPAAEQCQTPLAQVDLASLPLRHAPGNSDPSSGGPPMRLRSPQQQTSDQQQQQHFKQQPVQNQLAAKQSANSSSSPSSSSSQNNNYNKILAIDVEARQLIVCGSLNQGACRRHSLGQLSNYTDLIPLPVAPNDESSSSLAFIPRHQQQRLMYVAATNSRPDPYRDMVPAISARHLGPDQKSMQIIESSFAEARIDISFELRDYYLVNYVYAFQHGEFVYFATVQRRSPLRQLEEWGYITRLARLCLNDLSFQSYTEMTLECSSTTGRQTGQQQQQQPTNYNLLQDAQLISAGSELAQQLRLTKSSQVLAGVFAQSRDHSTRSQTKSALCLFPMEMIEQRFNENIQQCYNGTTKSRNMNYIGGSQSDCPRPGSASLANVCSEPLKLNGSLALTSRPVLTYDDELLTAIAAIQAPTSPISTTSASAPASSSSSSSTASQHQPNPDSARHWKSQRSHQVLVLGTGSGAIKRVLLQSNSGAGATEFDSIQLVDGHQQQPAEPVLADLHLTNGGDLIAGTARRIVKLKVNGCKQRPTHLASNLTGSNSQLANDCDQCQQLQDPFCGWCSSSGSCSTRDDCILAAPPNGAGGIQWSPFDQIKCNDYKPIEPRFVPLQSDNRREPTQFATVNVNVRQGQHLQQQFRWQQAGSQLAQAQFVCHFDYLKHANRSMTSPLPRVSGATTKATQARLNPHTGTVSIACPLPAPAQRPLLSTSAIDQTRVRLSVRLSSSTDHQAALLEELLGLSSSSSSSSTALGMSSGRRDENGPDSFSIQRELTMYDCSVHTSCRACLGAGSQPATDDATPTRKTNAWSCAWCPLSNRCTFSASHSEFGCAASAIAGPASSSLYGLASTTPQSVNNGVNNLVRASHLALSLDQAQANVFGISIERLAQCPLEAQSTSASSSATVSLSSSSSSSSSGSDSLSANTTVSSSANNRETSEILIASGSRRAIHLQLDTNRMAHLTSQRRMSLAGSRFECLLEIEGAKARLSARFVEPNTFVCQENQFLYQEDVATLRGQVSLVSPSHVAQTTADGGQAIDTFDVILYKCHLFGINPPALISTVVGGGQPGHHSSVAWRAHELLQSGALVARGQRQPQLALRKRSVPAAPGQTADCSLCLNIERKYQCTWCQSQGQCRHSDQCSAGDLQAGSTCPPPRIDSIHPTSGPLEGGTLITIEGSNLGSNEREIQDKITVGGEPCQLVMYSVSTRIVCKTSASHPQAATVFVGNRAGITSAYEKFHYKAVHLTDVNPRFGPVSGGTRLYLSGSNLNIGSRVQIFLDEIPCSIDASASNEGHQHSSNQISCITAPNLLASSMRITKLTLMIDNSTHHFPYPFTYQPDPIITSIEPAESFIAGGRLILVMGHHLASPQSTKLMVYHEHKHNIVNATSCLTQNDTLITCLTPAISRQLLSGAAYGNNQRNMSPIGRYVNGDDDDDDNDGGGGGGDGDNDRDGNPSSGNNASVESADDYRSILSYQSGGLRLKMSLIMDDVKSVRNLDEYYHHLPHYLTYYEDPQLFRLQPGVVDFVEGQDLIIQGENLQMKQLDQDMLITIGSHLNACLIKTITANQVSCEPPKKIVPVRDEHGQIMERPVLPIIALIGSNLRFNVGFMRYNSKLHYQQLDQQQLLFGAASSPGLYPSQFSGVNNNNDFYQHQPTVSASSLTSSSGSLIILIALSVVGFIVGLGATLMFALNRFRQSKAEREYKRIQLQIGLLDINGQPTMHSGGGLIFDKRLNYAHATSTPVNNHQQSAHRRALDYIGSLSSKKLLNQLTNGHQHHPPRQLPSFPSSPVTDISSLAGGNLLNSFNNQFGHPHHQQQQQHIIKLSNNGTISNSTYNGSNHIYSSANLSSLSSQSSPGSTRDQQHQPLVSHHQRQQQQQQQQFIDGHQSNSLAGNNGNLVTVRDQQNGFQSQVMKGHDKSPSLLLANGPAVATGGGNSRNFNWTQDAPSTIVPYAVIEACNLTFEGKNQPMKEFV